MNIEEIQPSETIMERGLLPYFHPFQVKQGKEILQFCYDMKEANAFMDWYHNKRGGSFKEWYKENR